MDYNTIKGLALQAMKDKDEVKRDILRLVVAECDRVLLKQKDVDTAKIIKKLIESNEQCIQMGSVKASRLVKENVILQNLLPKEIDHNDLYNKIVQSTGNEFEVIKGLDPRRSIGVVNKFMKENGLYATIDTINHVIYHIQNYNRIDTFSYVEP